MISPNEIVDLSAKNNLNEPFVEEILNQSEIKTTRLSFK